MSKYNVKLQTEASYKNIKYGQGTVYSAGCGPASLCNALYALHIANVSVPTMCSFAVSCGARVTSGTDMAKLLKAASSKYGFIYKPTSKNAELWEHLKNGGVAIMNNGNKYPLFSNSGHFVAAIGWEGTSTVIVADSYWYSGKYTANSIRRHYVTVVEKGVVKTSLTQCGKATIDRSPSYYLISVKPVTIAPTSEQAKVTAEELNVPSGAGTNYSVLGTLKQGAVVGVTGIANNGWYQIKYGNNVGYISGEYAERFVNKQVSSNHEEDDMKAEEVRQIIEEVREQERAKAASTWAAGEGFEPTTFGL